MTKIILAALLFMTAPAFAQIGTSIGGTFFAACGPADQPAVTMELDNHLRITVYKAALKSDDGYRTKEQVFEGEEASMAVFKCDDKMENCQSVEGVLTTYSVNDDTIEATLEYFDGTETQGDSESVQGPTASFTVKKDHDKPRPAC